MLRLEPFAFARPGSVDEAVALLAKHGRAARLIAGGTDVMPNLKHGLYEPEVVIGLSAVAELRGIALEGGGAAANGSDGELVIGAMTTLAEVESHPLVLARAPGLAQAARSVAGPTQRTMGTLGGNVCLDTRCVWINQSHFWRKSLGYCLKKDGTVCHVVQGGKSCVAAASNDTATLLCALGATLVIRSARGVRAVAIRDFYKPDGAMNQRLEPDELLTQIRVPAPRRSSGASWSGYAKLRARNSIDFPKLSIAVAWTTDRVGAIDDATLVVSAIAAVPRVIAGIADLARGGRADDPALIARLGEQARKVTIPLTNIDGDTGWRRAMVPVFVKRAFAAARMATTG
ncbi:MAG: 4-hydroxybenzoyl-CoA reductase subunit beta [Planctomycetes bacterium]|nr:4-hydroxybenzoyl-CoA reductase subunit beta [Planctomycetota bacterium]